MGVNTMKKILIILLLFCNLITSSFSKEIRSRFGFYIDVPDGLTAVQNLNIEELLKDYEGKDIDMDAFNDIMAGVSKKNMNVEYFFPSDLDPVKNAININIQEGDVNDIFIVGLKEMCKIYQKEYSRLFNKNIKQYECKQTSEFSPKFNPVIFCTMMRYTTKRNLITASFFSCCKYKLQFRRDYLCIFSKYFVKVTHPEK